MCLMHLVASQLCECWAPGNHSLSLSVSASTDYDMKQLCFIRCTGLKKTKIRTHGKYVYNTNSVEQINWCESSGINSYSCWGHPADSGPWEGCWPTAGAWWGQQGWTSTMALRLCHCLLWSTMAKFRAHDTWRPSVPDRMEVWSTAPTQLYELWEAGEDPWDLIKTCVRAGEDLRHTTV